MAALLPWRWTAFAVIHRARERGQRHAYDEHSGLAMARPVISFRGIARL
jgi:hypothetical protein